MGRKLIDLSGNKYGKLEVIELDVTKSTPNKHYWICRCECGNYKSVDGNKLKNGTIKGCGCLRGKITKYQIQNKKLYKKWLHMKSRCLNEKDISFKNYGARGIKVCNEWLDYNNFAKWSLENGFKEELELDRINTNGNYEPSNCRYITSLENRRNRRVTRKAVYEGKVMTLKEIAEIKNIKYQTLWAREKRKNRCVQAKKKDVCI